MIAPLYSLANIRRCFGGREVLRIPAMTLEKGKIYGLLGPNGAGKTTLMRLLAFMDVPTEGEIAFEGRTVSPERYGQYRARVVWVPQTPVLFSGSLLYNVEYPMRLKGVPGRQRRLRAMELLDSVGLASLAQAPARRLSGGEAQRGSIARALAAEAEVILFDEPTGNVDYRSRGEIMRIIHALWQERGLSLFVTTHDKTLADELVQEEITLFDGKVLSQHPLTDTRKGLPQEFSAVPARLRLQDGCLCAVMSTDGVACRFLGNEGVISGLAKGERGDVLIRLQGADGRWLDICVGAEDAVPARELSLGVELFLVFES